MTFSSFLSLFFFTGTTQPYKSKLYSTAGPQKIVTGGPNADIIDGKDGVAQYNEYDAMKEHIDNTTKHVGENYMTDTFSGMLRSSLESTEALGGKYFKA